MKLVEFKGMFTECVDIDCSGSSAVTEAWFRVEDEEARFFITYSSGAKWVYKVPAGVALAGLGMESVGRFVNLVLKPNAIRAHNV